MLRAASIGLVAGTLLCGCQQKYEWNGLMEDLLNSQPDRFATVMQDPAKYRVQIIYTQIDRDADNIPAFSSYHFRVNPDEYFYPASTVKLPTALLALEKINELAVPRLTRDTAMLTGAASDWQTPAVSDPTSPTGLPSVGHYVRKILLVSDNDAFNRLYEFIGQKPLNESMLAKGFRNTRIFHRLEVPRNASENAKTNPVSFVDGDATLYSQDAAVSDTNYAHDEPVLIGRAEILDGERLDRPKDFSGNNVFALQDLHDVMKTLIFPESVLPSRRFNLTEDDYRFVYRNMSAYPGESGISEYADATQYPDGYVKFFMYGGSAPSIPDNIRIFNKPGDAYGFLTDCAYIVDFENGVEFLLAATIYTNANETFNDDDYEYDEIALPFLRDLGQTIYEIELARDRLRAPDLGRFRQ